MTDGISKVVPPEAVPVRDDALNFGVVQAKDWVIPTACGVRVVDERMAYGWNECRKATIDRLESATTPAEVGESDVSRAEYVAGAVAAAWCKHDLSVREHRCKEAATMIRTLGRQLAEATRRLGEVEGLLRECQRRLGAEETLQHMTYREWSELDDRIDAALIKEPTK